MRLALRFAASLLLTVAIVWVGFEVWMFVAARDASRGILASLFLLPVVLYLTAWPAFVLAALAVALAWLESRLARRSAAAS